MEDLDVDEELASTSLEGELNIEFLVMRQIERTSLAATQDEPLFAANVRVLLSMLPSYKREEILSRAEEYTEVVQRYQYKYWCGVPIGTPENPIGGSPALVEEEVIDWHKLYEMILKAFEDSNLTWRFEKWTIEMGKVEDKDRPIPPPTPLLAPTAEEQKAVVQNQVELKQQIQQPTERAKRIRRCAICGKHVEPRTGIFYKKKLVHKDECWAAARVKWGKDELEEGVGVQ